MLTSWLVGCSSSGSQPPEDSPGDADSTSSVGGDAVTSGGLATDANLAPDANLAADNATDPSSGATSTNTKPPETASSDTSASNPGAAGPGGEQSPSENTTGVTSTADAPHVKLSPELLDESLALGRKFMLASQTSRGNFRYVFDASSGTTLGADDQVRQAGALWGLTSIHAASPSPESEAAVRKGLDFYRRCSVAHRESGAFIEYPGDFKGRTGTMALVNLAAIRFLQSNPTDPAPIQRQFDAYLKFLLSLRRSDYHFYREYRWTSGEGVGAPSAYFDGESLLVMTQAAVHLKRDELRPMALESAETMWRRYVEQAREADPDSDLTKGFYQWGTMAFFDIYAAGWEGGDVFAARAIELAHWMIDVHRTLERRRNTAYAHEGLACAWELARRTGDTQSQRKIEDALHQGMHKLTTWQIGNPIANRFLQDHPLLDASAIGGVMGSPDDLRLRIDTTQHQMHAVILARRFLFP